MIRDAYICKGSIGEDNHKTRDVCSELFMHGIGSGSAYSCSFSERHHSIHETAMPYYLLHREGIALA